MRTSDEKFASHCLDIIQTLNDEIRDLLFIWEWKSASIKHLCDEYGSNEFRRVYQLWLDDDRHIDASAFIDEMTRRVDTCHTSEKGGTGAAR